MPSLSYKLWKKMSPLPMGNRAWSRLVALKAPYFQSISPLMQELGPGKAVATLRKRRRLTNHIGTVHAIAMCNLAEFVGGLMTDVSVPDTHRWIPKGMTVEYLHKAESDLTARCICDPLPAFGQEAFEWPTRVEVEDKNAQIVFRAEIRMWISPKAPAG